MMRGVEDDGAVESDGKVEEGSVEGRPAGKNLLDCLCSSGGRALERPEIGDLCDGLERSDAMELAVGREGMLWLGICRLEFCKWLIKLFMMDDDDVTMLGGRLDSVPLAAEEVALLLSLLVLIELVRLSTESVEVALGGVSVDPLFDLEDEDSCDKVVLLEAVETDSPTVSVSGEVVLVAALPELEGKSEDMTDDPI